MNPLHYFRAGDWFVVLLGVLLTAWLAATFWQGGAAQKVVIRAGGQLFTETRLDQARRIAVPGPLGVSLVEIEPGRVRVAADPSPRQLCVKQGWLARAGDAALCLPNQISVELVGTTRRFDSLNY
ncbi:MAG: NusG domain II-containing protein [Hydrogenophilales bacterium]|nr:NusG domain II-containing protein [Hydrogenophilales bacterium]